MLGNAGAWPDNCGSENGSDGTATGCDVGGYDGCAWWCGCGIVVDETGWGSVEGGMLYCAAGAGRPELWLPPPGVEVCLAMFARASRIDELFGAGAAAGGA